MVKIRASAFHSIYVRYVLFIFLNTFTYNEQSHPRYKVKEGLRHVRHIQRRAYIIRIK